MHDRLFQEGFPTLLRRRSFKDAEFHGEYKKLTGEDSGPLMPEEIEKAIREIAARRR